MAMWPGSRSRSSWRKTLETSPWFVKLRSVPVSGGDAGALLPAVLQGEQAVESQLCGFVVRRSGKVCAYDPARFAGSVGLNDRQPAAYCQESLAPGSGLVTGC